MANGLKRFKDEVLMAIVVVLIFVGGTCYLGNTLNNRQLKKTELEDMVTTYSSMLKSQGTSVSDMLIEKDTLTNYKVLEKGYKLEDLQKSALVNLYDSIQKSITFGYVVYLDSIEVLDSNVLVNIRLDESEEEDINSLHKSILSNVLGNILDANLWLEPSETLLKDAGLSNYEKDDFLSVINEDYSFILRTNVYKDLGLKDIKVVITGVRYDDLYGNEMHETKTYELNSGTISKLNLDNIRMSTVAENLINNKYK